jgi:hypothetical protein
MDTMIGFQKTNCVFNCSPKACDSLEHYCRCPVLADSFNPEPTLATGEQGQPIDRFFAVGKGLTDQEKIASARKLHVSLRLVHFARLNGHDHDWKLLAAIESNKA